VPRYTNFEEEEEDEEEVFSMMGVDGKRGREEGWSAVAYVRDVKRRKVDGEGVVDVTREGVIDLTAEDGDKEDVDHVESSVWSWPIIKRAREWEGNGWQEHHGTVFAEGGIDRLG
jgi:hypothetical protein